MKIKLPSPVQFCEKEGYEIPSANFMKYTAVKEIQKSIIDVMKEYGELCAKHGAKSIRYQAIDLLGNTGFSLLDEGYKPEHVEYINELINKIQNLEP